jgi:hypothetical protein
MVSFVRNQKKSDRFANMKLFSETVNLFMGHHRKILRASSKLARGKFAENWPETFKNAT